jgi:hypothetical protein
MTRNDKMKIALLSIYKTFNRVSLSFLFLLPCHASSLEREREITEKNVSSSHPVTTIDRKWL